MATITFPSNPVLNQIYSYDGNTWIWDGSSWQLLTDGALNGVVIGNVVPGPGTFTTLTADTITANSVTSGTVSTDTISANAVLGGTLSGTSLSLSGNVLGPLRVQNAISGVNITAYGTISAEDGIISFGNVSAPYFVGDGSLLTNLPSGTNYSNANVAAYLPTYTGNLSAGNVSILGNIFGNGVSILGQVVASGNINGNNFNTTGRISAAGNVVGNYIFGNGALLTGLNNNYGNANVAAFLPSYTGDINAGNIAGGGAGLRDLTGANVTGTVANAAYATLAGSASVVAGANVIGTVPSATQAITAGTVTTAAQPNITSVGILSSLTAAGNITGGNLKINTAASVAGNITANYFIGNGALLTGLPSLNYSNANVAAYLQTANIPIRASTLTATTVSVGLVDASGNVLGGNIRSAGQLVAGTTVSAAGNVTGANILTAGRVSAAGNVSGAYIFGDGRFLTNLPSSYGNADVAAYLANNTGALAGSSLNVSGDITASNLYLYGEEFTTENIVAFGNISGGNLNTTGWISTTGNVHAQTYFGDGSHLTGIPYNDYSDANVAAFLPTYTGALSGNSVNVAGNVTSTGLSVSGAAVIAGAATSLGNVRGANLLTTGVVSAGTSVVAPYFFGDGRYLTNLPTGNYSNANVAAYLPTYGGLLTGSEIVTTGNVTGSTISATTRVIAPSITAVGNITAVNLAGSGSLSVSGNVIGTYLYGNGAFLTGISGTYSNAAVAAYLPTYTGNLNPGNVAVSGTLTVAGNTAGTNISVTGNVAANNFSGFRANFSGNVTANNVIAQDDVSALGNVIGDYFIGNGSLLTGMNTYSNANVSSYLTTYSGTLTAGSLSVAGGVVANDLYSYGKVFATTIVSAVGNVSGGNINTPGWVSAQGNVHAQYYFGDGSHLTNITANYSNANVAAYLTTYTGNLSAGSINSSGNISGQYFIGNGALLTGVQATQIGVLPNLSVTGNINTGNLNTAGNVSANYFIGDGSRLANLPAGNYSNANVASYLPTYTGSLIPSTVSAAGNITAPYFIGNGSQLSGMYSNASVASYLPTYSGNLNPNTVSAAGNITAQYFVGNGSQLTGIQATQIGVLPSLSVTGNIDTGNLIAQGKITAFGNVTTADSVITGNVYASGVISASANITGGNIVTTNQVVAAGNIVTQSGSYFVGNGRFLTGVVTNAVAANTLTGNTLSSNVLYSSLQTVGTLSNLSVGGNVAVSGVISTAANIVTSNNVLATTLSATGNVTGDYILGNGSQLTGIVATSIGVLPSLSVTGNITVGPGGYYIGDGGRLSNINVTTTYGNSNVAAYLPTYTGNLSGGNVNISGVYYGNGAGLTNLAGANVVGSVANATYAISASSAVTAARAATVTSNAQPNITSVGTLTSLVTSGNANIGGNLSVSGNIYGTVVGNIIGNLVIPGGNTEVVFNNNGTACTSPNFKFNSSTQQLLLTGLASATGNIVTDQYFVGNGAFLTGLPASYSNANVAAYLPTYTGNLTAGNVSVSGNITGNYILGNASRLSNVPSVLTVSNWFNGNVISNTISNVTALRFNGNTGITVQDLGNSEALVSLGSSFKTWEVDGQANLVAVGEDVVKFVAGPGIVITTNANAYPQQIAFAADIPNISNGTSNITVLNNGNIRAVVAGADVATFTTTGLTVVGNVSASNYVLGNGAFLTGLPAGYSNADVAAYLPTYTGNLTANVVSTTGNITAPYFIGNGSQLTGVTASNVGTLTTLSVTGNVTAGGATFNGNVGITGNLSVAGNVNYVNVTDLVVGDPMIYFAANNTGNLLDIGWVGAYDDGLYQHTGLVRDHTDGVWKLFSNVVNEPTTVIDWANALYDQFQAGDITSTGVISATGNITGNVFVGNGAGLTNLAGANVTGTVANATYAVTAGTAYSVDGANVTGTVANATYADSASTAVTVTANAQPNITSVGTLTSISVSGNALVGNISTAGNVTAGYFIGDGSLLTNINPGNISGLIGNAIDMGSNSQGQLVSNAVTLTTTTSVTNGIALLNQVLGKLVPPAPTNFPGGTTLTISSLSTYRMCNFVQTDNTPGANKSVAGGTTVTSVRRASSYSTNTIANFGPGDSGTVIAVLNGANAGNVTLTSALTGNGTYSNLVITNNYDYKVANANITAGFWSVFTSQASGTVNQGWNEVYIADTATGNTNTASWYYDASAPGTPAFSSLSISPTTTSLTYSSTVGHYNTSTQFTLGFGANRLSGDMYPTSDTFVTGTAGGAFAAPVSVTYAGAGVTTPLARNLYVSSGSQSVTTTSNVTSGFGASSTGPSVSVVNSYATGTQAFTSSLNANVLYKTGTASTMEESNVVVGGTIGSGSGAAFRIVNPGSTDTPTYTGSEAAFDSQNGPLQTYDATIVAAVLKHDQTNYSTGYLPVGPDLSSGRSGAQYFTFKIQRSSVSKFDVKWTGTIAGLWVALPGSLIDSTSTLNGWLDMSVAYGGAGAPGANTGAGGNGSNGCALGGVAPLNSAQTNKSVTATFGTVSSTSATNNEIYIRIKLTSGQSVTALSLQPSSN